MATEDPYSSAMEAGAPDWLARVASVRKWSRGGARAPHKPLLLLYALGRLQQRGANDPVAYVDAEAPLARLLADYGPPNKTTPAYPFKRLASDGLWQVTSADGGEVEDQPGALRRAGATGRLDGGFAAALMADPALLVRCARLLLETEFPESFHAAIAQDVGLDLEGPELADVVPIAERRRRSAAFRAEVLVAYEYCCAMCGYGGRIGNEAVGLEAAHVRWWAFEGPDEVANGLALCTMHHLLFDRGVLGVTTERTVAVSRHFVGHDPTSSNVVLHLVGRELGEPQAGLPPVDEGHLAWHRSQVFRGPSR
jgi:putative restriction endonuclease